MNSDFAITIAFWLFVVAYFLPTGVAFYRGKRDRKAILWLNVLAGWTFVGWVVAIVWALTTDQPKAHA